ncbi:MAG: SdrD B-like domain-containing protein [Planctomycetaceae bacterium]
MKPGVDDGHRILLRVVGTEMMRAKMGAVEKLRGWLGMWPPSMCSSRRRKARRYDFTCAVSMERLEHRCLPAGLVGGSLQPTIDLQLSKSASTGSPHAGDEVTWTLTVTNNASQATSSATGVVVQDVIPSGQTFVVGSTVVPAGGSFDPATGIWTVGSAIAPGGSSVLSFRTVAATTAEFTTAVTDLQLSGAVPTGPVSAGQSFSWSVTVANHAEGATSAATGVTIGHLLPPGVTFAGASATAGTFNSATGTWDLSSVTLAPGATQTLTITATAANAGSTLNFAAEVLTQNEPDIDSTPANSLTSEDDDFTASIAVAAAAAGSRNISGLVFLDSNRDGQSAGESGVAGIRVSAFGPDGSLQNSSTTTAAGTYQLTGVTTEAVRLEFTALNGLTVSTAQQPPASTNTVSSVAFLPAGSAAAVADLAVAQPSADAIYTTTCFVYSGHPSTNLANEPAVLVFNADGSAKAPIASIAQVGTTNGLAIQPLSGDTFAAAFQKRHSDIGPAGNSAIYRIDTSGSVTTFIQLDQVFGTDSTGPYSHSPSDWFSDSAAFGAVGKVSLGDVDISSDGRFLYTVNLATRELIQIPVSNTTSGLPVDYVVGDARKVRRFSILGDDDSSPSNGGIPLGLLGVDPLDNIRPFALAERDGLIYVGMVNSAQTTQGSGDLAAYVFLFDPVSGTFQQTPAVSFPLGTRSLGNGWQPWTDTWSDLPTFYDDTNDYFIVGSNQPWLTDIEFDTQGDMILGFRDRTGDQVGHMVGDPTGADSDGNGLPDRFYHDTKGDTLRLTASSTGTWTVEPGQLAGDNSEYYAGDNPTFDPLGPILHPESTQGGLIQVPGFSSITSTAVDAQSFWSGGVIWLDNASGEQTDAVDIYVGSELPTSTTFGKNNGLGDLEYTNNLSMEIGNRIWLDTDRDGIQDAGEPGIPGIQLELFDVSDPLAPLKVATATSKRERTVFLQRQQCKLHRWR